MADLTKKSKTDLIKLLQEKRETVRKFKFSIVGSKTRNVKEGRNTSREIARILTELNARN